GHAAQVPGGDGHPVQVVRHHRGGAARLPAARLPARPADHARPARATRDGLSPRGRVRRPWGGGGGGRAARDPPAARAHPGRAPAGHERPRAAGDRAGGGAARVTGPAPEGERLQKVLAHAGIASRRAAEELILAGRVQVNGTVVTTLGTRVDPARDQVAVDGRVVAGPGAAGQPAGQPADLVTYLLNKPSGVVSTASDPQGRAT